MLTRPNSYQLMWDELQEIVKSYEINLTKCDAFEEILLLFAEVKERPKACRFGASNSQQRNV